MDEVRSKVDDLLRKVLKTERKITPEKFLLDDLNLTSLNMMELIALVEDEFNIIVPVNKVLDIKTVGELYYAVENMDEILKT